MADVLRGGADGDTLNGVAGIDTLHGEAGIDTLNGGADPDGLLGGSDGDTLNGDGGIDDLQGEAGDDTLNGGTEDDWLYGGAGSDALNGGDGIDTATYAGETQPVTVNLGVGGPNDGSASDVGADNRDNISTTDVEAVVGGNANDFLQGTTTTFAVTLSGGPGADVLRAGFGAGTLLGGDGNDDLLGGPEPDSLDGGTGNDVLNGGDSGDSIAGGAGNDQIEARDPFADTVACGAGTDTARTGTTDTRTGCEPGTTITRKPAKTTTARRATFRFVSANPAGAKFQCKLDRKAWAPCSSGKTYARLARGAHTFRVRARDKDGTLDPTPAAYTWRIR